MRNMQQERGTEDFSLYVGQVKVGPWTKMFDGTLQLGTQVSQRFATRQYKYTFRVAMKQLQNFLLLISKITNELENF